VTSKEGLGPPQADVRRCPLKIEKATSSRLMTKAAKPLPTPAVAWIESRILLVRGQKVMRDADLAELYAVTTKRLNEQVRRNLERFPQDFCFQLTNQEVAILRSQFATSSSNPGRLSWGGRRSAPVAFTEHGAIMAATVLNSARAIEVSVFVVRAFVRLREMVASNQALAKKLEELERRFDTHDQAIVEILQAIRKLMTPPATGPKRKIGFV